MKNASFAFVVTKIPNRSNLGEKSLFWLMVQVPVHHGGKGTTAFVMFMMAESFPVQKETERAWNTFKSFS